MQVEATYMKHRSSIQRIIPICPAEAPILMDHEKIGLGCLLRINRTLQYYC